jgi:hypothetical protein
MGLIEMFKQKYEEVQIDKANAIAEKKARIEELEIKQQQEKQAQLNKLLDMPIEKERVIQLHHYIRTKHGHILYGIYDYFLCVNTKREFGYGETMEIIKITGSNLGEGYVVCPNGQFATSIVLKDKDGLVWEGNNATAQYIPATCKTIRDLNNYANKQNEGTKKEYKEKMTKIQYVNNDEFSK